MIFVMTNSNCSQHRAQDIEWLKLSEWSIFLVVLMI